MVVLYACAVTCGRSFTVSSVWGVLISFLECFRVFSHPPLPFYYFYIIIIVFIVFTFIRYYCKLLLFPQSSWLCVTGAWAGAGCGGRGLVAGLRVGLACGVLLLPGFGVSSSSPQVPGHPTSICDAGVNCTFVCLPSSNTPSSTPSN